MIRKKALICLAALCLTQVAWGQTTATDWYARGVEYFEQDEFDRAVEAFSEAVGLNPD
jgi:tetratricopeptide (TPR) repeat protein